ncbi:hypothetical protein FDP41_006679 [Naegleria fowleri]|uniref:HAMP domain-containing protein n=1 Tax=Naegleria fowleri TaxID=5763 RepID=A0A6A5BME3_NAEFO|nr:uncharacterized protein FDP41_006679 [Naegleria fowleri]KAF0974069.1 hypothetical protein FDP41_006679 [Naegleria fowleri]
MAVNDKLPITSELVNNFLNTRNGMVIDNGSGYSFFKTGEILSSYNRKCSIDVENSGSTRMAVFQFFNDFKNQKRLSIRTDVSRSIFEIASSTFQSSILVILGIFITVSMICFILFEIVIIRRLINIRNHVRTITNENNFSKTIPKSIFNDELEQLSADINTMLRSLLQYQNTMELDTQTMQSLLERISLAEEQARCVMNIVQDFILIIDASDGAMLTMNSAFKKHILNTKEPSTNNCSPNSNGFCSNNNLSISQTESQELISEVRHQLVLHYFVEFNSMEKTA